MSTTGKNDQKGSTIITTSIAPWLSVKDGYKAVDFYKAAFAAVETYRMEPGDGSLVVKLSVDGAEFWLSGESAGNAGSHEQPQAESPVRMIITVADPDAMFSQALNAGASEIFPVGEDYGWRLGRLADPFGFHWEIGHQLAPE